ncbi:UMP kinase [Rubinisphaera italica]|uniref:Uridylate kinase n=1 Tax=Rubinisphaera italica TaxID=2527969 RepID=A0A5C5X9V2_9PLAN|nr:UMP kinase [Rubinisphaera italica]TWT59937.1 Uridylate kinase [Rubinisphaera italica]HBN76028.1 UMP kinase [Planctomycetaceae bacterium]
MSESTAPLAYKRVLLKLTGESFCRDRKGGISMTEITRLSEEIRNIVESGVELAIVCGGGNILRGKQFSDGSEAIKPATAHYMGMLATVINGLALQDALEHIGVPTRLQSAISMDSVAEPFIRRRCVRHLEKGRVVILAGGTGSPYVTTDTAAALRAREIEADIVMKATRVDGVYSDDPEKNPHAIRYDRISFQDVIAQRLQVMDAQAFHHCMEHDIPILIFDFQKAGNIINAARGVQVGTLVNSNAAS